MKKIFLLLTIIISFTILVPNAYADTASVRLVTNRIAVEQGKTTTVSIVVDASARIRGGQFNLDLNNSNFEIVSVVGANGLTVSSNGNFHIAYRIEADYSIASGRSIATVTLRAKSGVVGIQSIMSVTNIGVTLEGSYTTVSAPNRSLTVSVAEAPVVIPTGPKSSNNFLKELRVEGLTIPFVKETTTYNLTVANTVTSLQIVATQEDSKATVAIKGNANFKPGTNTVLVEVTAENGQTKTYKLIVNKSASNNNKLQSLTIEGYELIPSFSKNTNRYEINIKDKEISALNITYVLEDSNAKVDIIGNEDLIEGKNVIKLVVTAENGEVFTYNIIANVGNQQTSTSSDSLITIIFIVISGMLLTYIVAQAIMNNKKKKIS